MTEREGGRDKGKKGKGEVERREREVRWGNGKGRRSKVEGGRGKG